MTQEETAAILGVTVTDGYEGPPNLFSEEERQKLRDAARGQPEGGSAGLKPDRPYVPSDPARPWMDPFVQSCVRRFFQEVVLPPWIKNHPHKPCSGMHIDDWGRHLCQYIKPNNGVDGPWQNPTHFAFYAYNTFAAYSAYGITLNGFLTAFCDIQLK